MTPLDHPEVKQKLIDYAMGLGFTDQELQIMSQDQRIVELALKAMAWDKMHEQNEGNVT